jgi:hypothetical protein
MIEDTIQRIEARIQGSENLPPKRREELAALLVTLKSEIAELSATDADQARTIAGYADVSTHEATRAQRDPDLLAHSLDGMARSVEGFEASHPRLVQTVNTISHALSNLGI